MRQQEQLQYRQQLRQQQFDSAAFTAKMCQQLADAHAECLRLTNEVHSLKQQLEVALG
jgi:hypothetical protein